MTVLAISQSQYLAVRKTPESFLDGLISSREAGIVTINFLHDEECILRIFEAPIDCENFSPGEPVAFHRGAGVLACSDLWVSAKELIVHL
jgi:hypothetical protein